MIGNLFSFAFMTACSLFTIHILAKIIKYVVLFSKIVIAILAALVLCQYVTLVPANGIINFSVICAIFLVLCFLMGRMPRVNVAFTYLCNLFFSTAVGTMAVQELLGKIGIGQSMNKYLLLLVYAISAVISFRVLKDQLIVEKDLKFLPLRAIDRLLGAAINTITLFYGILQTINFPDNIPLFIAALGISIAVFYILDLLLFHRISGYFTGRKMPSEIKNLLDPNRKKRKFGLFSFLNILDWDSSPDLSNSGSDWAEEDRLRRERDLEEDYQAARREREAYEYQQQQIESANRYYDDNY